MADPLQSNEVMPPLPREDYKGPLGAFGWGLTWLDYGVYCTERAIVILSLITMTIIEFVYILSLYVTEQKIAYLQAQDPNINASIPTSLFVLLGFIFLMMTAVAASLFAPKGRAEDTAQTPTRPMGVRIAIGLGLTLLVAVFSSLTVLFASSTYYLLLTLAVFIPSILFFYFAKERTTAYVLGGLLPFALWLASNVPDGYSWADKRALFLLLWVGFLGASMAAKQWRHLKIDIARKLCPDHLLPRFNGVSYLFAAIFSGLLVYIGGIYLFNEDYGRFWSSTIPGEIPDWLKVASIPVAFLIITLRFGARGLGLLIWGKESGLMPEEVAPLEAVEVEADAPNTSEHTNTDNAEEGS